MNKKKNTRIFSMGMTLACLQSVVLAAMLLVGAAQPEPMALDGMSSEPKQIGTYFKEPIVIEKEVIVYVEKEPEVIEKIVTIDEPVVANEIEYLQQEEYVSEPQLQYINEWYNVFEPSYLTEEDLDMALGDGSRSGLKSITGAIVDAESIYGVNSLYLLSTIGYESGWGKHRSGLNNVAGWKSTTTGTFKDFSSEYECVMTVAEGLVTSFSEDVGPYLKDVAWRYCKDPGYLETLMRIMQELQNNIY